MNIVNFIRYYESKGIIKPDINPEYKGVVYINNYILFCGVNINFAIKYINNKIKTSEPFNPEYNNNYIILGDEIIYKYIFKNIDEILSCGITYNHIMIDNMFYGSKAFAIQKKNYLYHPQLEPNGMIHPHIKYNKFIIPRSDKKLYIRRVLDNDISTYKCMNYEICYKEVYYDKYILQNKYDIDSVILFNKYYGNGLQSAVQKVYLYSKTNPQNYDIFAFTNKKPDLSCEQFNNPKKFYAKYFTNIDEIYVPQNYGLEWSLVRELILLKRQYNLPRPIFKIIMIFLINLIIKDYQLNITN